MSSSDARLMTQSTRRTFLRTASVLAAATPCRSLLGMASERAPTVYVPRVSGVSLEPDVYALAERAVDAAMRAGAVYADARLTVTRVQQLPWLFEEESWGFGVRALVNGYWGFLASAVWTPDEAVRLGSGAVAQANAHRRGKTRPVELGTLPVVTRGEWVMPVKYDPFDIPIAEKLDVMASFADLAETAQSGISTQNSMAFRRQHRVFVSSDGISWSQTTYTTGASFAVFFRDSYFAKLPSGVASADGLSSAGRGWELVSESGLAAAIPQLIDQADQARHQVPADVGRYDMVFGAEAMASLVDATLGAATELDRALGYEANASGTSYLDKPETFLGAVPVASPRVTLLANRSLPGGSATVRWDDEGVVPDDFTIIRSGVLVDYQTTREQAAWLAPYYQRAGRPIRSHGCAAAGSALDITMQHPPNIALMPSAEPVTFETLVAGTEKGIAVLDINVSMDQQLLNGMGSGTMREIVHGKLGRFIRGGAIAFRAPELWKSVAGLGGAGTQRWYGYSRGKGEPRQSVTYSIGAVPAKIPQLSLIDEARKA